MKRTLSLLGLCLLAGTSVGSAQLAQLTRAHSLSLSAETVGVGGGTTTKDGTHSSNHSTDNHIVGMGHRLTTNETQKSVTSESVQISVRNFGNQPDAAHVEWYFFSMPARVAPGTVGDPRHAFDHGARDVSVAGSGVDTFTVDSQEITATTRRKNTAFYRASGHVNVSEHKSGGVTQSGSKVSGWVVRLIADGRVLDAKGSSQDLESIARDNGRLQALTAKDTGE